MFSMNITGSNTVVGSPILSSPTLSDLVIGGEPGLMTAGSLHTEDCVGASNRAVETCSIVEFPGDQLGARSGQGLRRGAGRVTRQRADSPAVGE